MKSLYLRLAAGNIKNSRRFYLPFLLTAVMTVACFFILCSVGLSQTLPGGQTVILVMRFGVIVVAIFSVIFLYYTNSFLIKRRKKELGLYNILGMEKRHIAKVMLWETLFSALIAIGGGLDVYKRQSSRCPLWCRRPPSGACGCDPAGQECRASRRSGRPQC